MYMYIFIYIYIYMYVETSPPVRGRLDDADFFVILKSKREKKRAKRRVRDTGVYVYRGRPGLGKKKRPGSTLVVFPA